MSKEILIVDDSPSVRRMVSMTLQQAGYTVAEAVDGAKGLEAAKARRYDMVITDQNMPNMTGLELLQNIRQNSGCTDMPVLMVTAEGLKENVLEAVKAGVSNYVVKPFTAEVLQEKIETIFKKMAASA